MASPPFDLSIVTPGDSDIVSQFPLNERNTRDVIESWLLVNHNNLGQHVYVDMPHDVPPSAPGASVSRVFANVDGELAIRTASVIKYVGLPSGTVIWTASSTTPEGYLVPDGSAVSRSTFATLFGNIGTTYGAGNGSTTFNLPDIRGRVVAGEDSGANRLTSTYFSTAAVLTAVGGSESNNVILTHTHIANAVPDHQHFIAIDTSSSTALAAGTSLVRTFDDGSRNSYSLMGFAATPTIGLSGASGGHTPVIQNAGSASAHKIIQPTIILRALIKT